MKQNRMIRRTAVALIAAMMTLTAWSAESNDFAIRRGVNLSHWLSQSNRRGAEREAYNRAEDFERLARIGYDHVRLPVDEEQLWDEAGKKEPAAFQLLHNAIKWAGENDLRVIVDLHILRSHHFNNEERPLWTDPKAQEQFVNLWRQLSAELKQYPVDRVAYELMNEPVADDPDDWNQLVAKGVAAIRETEPTRKIVVGSNRWQSVDTFDALKIPEGDRNIILSFHFYSPMVLTHYTASWTGVGKYTGPVHYPGWTIRAEEIEPLEPDMAKLAKQNAQMWNKDVMADKMAKPLALAKKLDLPLYCGEWGCYQRAPREARLAWYRDMRETLEAHNIAWANWDYKGGFAITAREGEFDQDLVAILLPAAPKGVTAPGAKLELLADGFKFTEGPATDREGNVYFTDQPNNTILKWSVDGKLSTFHESPGRANGLYFDEAGALWACADEKNELWKIAMDGTHRVILDNYDGKRLNGPNDLWIDAKGGIYFTDPFYKRPYWNRGPKEQDGEHVYYLAPDHKTLTRVVEDLKQPNGIIGASDGKTLYVADIGAGKTYAYAIQDDATLTNKRLIAPMGSDGMTLDHEGNLYLTGKGVTVFNPRGEQIDHIDVPKGWTANVTFGGKDRQTLFITAQDSLFAIRMRVRGN